MRRIKEGRKIRTLAPYNMIIPYIMVHRHDSQNSIKTFVEVAGAESLVRKLRADGYDSIGILHVMIAAYIRALSQRPGVNRFIRGQRIWARNGIVVNMAIKRKMSLDGQETTIKVRFEPTDTLIDVYHKFNKVLEENMKDDGSGGNATDVFAAIIGHIPGLVKKFIVWLLKLMDYFGLIPGYLIREASPFHGSLFITSMASLNIRPIRHHLYNFGNVPLFLAFGAKRPELVLNEDGSVTKHRVVDFVFNIDERICDGYYFASAMKIFKKYLTAPEGLLEPPEQVIEDVR